MVPFLFVKRKPRDSRVVVKRLTGEKKILRLCYDEIDLPVKNKNTIGGFIYDERNRRH